MKTKGTIITADLERDIVTIALPKDFFKHNKVRGGIVEIETDCFIPVKEQTNAEREKEKE